MHFAPISRASFSGFNIFKINKKTAKPDDDPVLPYKNNISIDYIPDFLSKYSRTSKKECNEKCKESGKTEEKHTVINPDKKSKKPASNPDNPNPRRIQTYHIPDFLLKYSAESVEEPEQTPEEKAEAEKYKALDYTACNIISYEGSECLEGTEYLVKELFEEYGDDKDAMKYILLRAINRKKISSGGLCTHHEPYPDFLKAYLNEINSYFKDNKNKRREYLDMALFTKNKDGNTLAHAAVRPTGTKSSEIFRVLFDATEEFPDLQLKILKDKDEKYEKTIGERVGYIFNKNEDSTIINKTLHRLCAETDSLSRVDAINLLTENSSVLDETNKKLLQTLKSKKRARAYDNKKARHSTKHNNTGKLQKNSRNTAKRKTERNKKKQYTSDSKIINFKEADDKPYLSRAVGDNSPSIRFYDCAMEG